MEVLMLVSKVVMQLRYLVPGGMLALSLAGCSAHAGMGVHTHTVTYAEVDSPRLVFAEPPVLVAVDRDVWVVEDSEHEVFWVGGFYWVHHGGLWYRSTSYADGWVRAEVNIVPTQIVRIRRGAYVAYHRPPGAVVRIAGHATATKTAPPGHRDPPGMRRGHDRKVLGDVESRGHRKNQHKNGRR
jgi:uncharacterized protein YcfL